MIPTTLADLASAVGGRVVDADPAALVTGASIDSRSVSRGDLFVALVGERTDGHTHARQALADGATAVLAAREVAGPAIIVADPAAALGPLATSTLAAMPDLRVVGVTGSSGKTTTKDLLAHVLAGAAPTHANPGSFNNDLGLPLTVLRTPPGTRHLVLEYGARGPGHIRRLMQIAWPDVAIVLNVGTAHLGQFGTTAALAAAKAELVAGEGTAILNADDPVVRAMATDRRVLLAGESAEAHVRAFDVRMDGDGRARFGLAYEGTTVDVAMRLVGGHVISDAVCAAGAALVCGLDLALVADRLSSAVPASRWRMEVTERADGVTVINDAYNANPQSMSSALRSLATVGGGTRRTWAVLGEMAELGDHAITGHTEVGRLIRELDIDEVLLVGSDSGGLSALRVEAGGRTVVGVDEALQVLDSELRAGDVVLVKASRAAGLERVGLGLLSVTGQGGAP